MKINYSTGRFTFLSCIKKYTKFWFAFIYRFFFIHIHILFHIHHIVLHVHVHDAEIFMNSEWMNSGIHIYTELFIRTIFSCYEHAQVTQILSVWVTCTAYIFYIYLSSSNCRNAANLSRNSFTHFSSLSNSICTHDVNLSRQNWTHFANLSSSKEWMGFNGTSTPNVLYRAK